MKDLNCKTCIWCDQCGGDNACCHYSPADEVESHYITEYLEEVHEACNFYQESMLDEN